VFGEEEPETTSPTESPITTTNAAAATIHVLLLFESHRRTFSFEDTGSGWESFIVMLLTFAVVTSAPVTHMD
jgi:hypothetical protein